MLGRAPTVTGCLAGCLLAGCATTLLPSTTVEVPGRWASFAEARSAIEGFERERTTAGDLRAAGVDPFTNPNVELLNYSDILRRFPHAGSLSLLDPGLRECLEAGRRCVGYAIDIRKESRERVGPFLLDVLSFRRDTRTTGWTFNALVLLVNDRVVYALYGGKPAISGMEKVVEPMGPFQDWNGSGVIR